MHIAVVGCGHGEVDKIYEVVDQIEQQRGIKVSLVLCCGDFQSVRNMTDLRCMACPVKYQQMHDFQRYYSGEKKAPILTLFIGGNHEASNYLQELPYGGWVAPNMFYMGYTGVYRFGHLRIAGISGIYKGQDYLKGRFEAPPYDQSTMRSVYHYRNIDIFRLKQLQTPVDIVLSHDWPRGIHQYGNTGALLRRKPFFREEIERNDLGSRPLFEVLERVRPSFWFSAHMHVKFAAYVSHTVTGGPKEGEVASLANVEIVEDVTQTQQTSEKHGITKFLALDKVLPRRQFLQIIEIPPPESHKHENEPYLEYDPEWLAILRNTNYLVSTKPKPCFMPGPGGNSRYEFSPTTNELEEVMELFGMEMKVPLDFLQTAPAFKVGDTPKQAFPVSNPQTERFCQKLGVTDPLQELMDGHIRNPLLVDPTSTEKAFSSGECNITLNETCDEISTNPDEISLDLEEEYNEIVSHSREMSTSKGTTASATPEPLCRRTRLVLPPPKASEPEDSGINPKPAADTADMDLLQSILGTSQKGSELGFFIDTGGRGGDDEPSSKRKKDLG